MTQGQKIGYIRVSSTDQNPARQREQMQALALDRLFEDHASGKNMSARPELQAMIGYARSGDDLFVASMDRLARNLEDLLRIVHQLNEKGVTVHFIKEKQTLSPEGSEGAAMSRLMLGVMGAVAEFERELIRERQREGIALAKGRGAYKGRKPVDKEKIEQAAAMIKDGIPKAEVARKIGISRATLYKYVKSEMLQKLD